jgi:gamma-glutamyl hercynylcysteine S-oxide synthase
VSSENRLDRGRRTLDSGLSAAVTDARDRSLALVADLSDAQLMGPRLPTVSPLLWEIGHAAWFQEKWVLRDGGRLPSIRSDADALWDSMAIPHDVRWDLPLPSREETFNYSRQVLARCLETLEQPDGPRRMLHLLTLFHEDMHTEAFTYTRQTLAYPPPAFLPALPPARAEAGPLPGDVHLPGGEFRLGAEPEAPFVFDNEQWSHPVEVAPFAIARAPVTQGEFAAFVEDGGYRREALWSPEGWAWRAEAGAEQPLYWRRGGGGGWERRDFDRWARLEPHRPALHVNWHEAGAYCRWAGRRLPTEAEWEMAASWDPAAGRKRRYPWGDTAPGEEHANLDWRGRGCVDVAAFPAGDSPAGCRQMIGNVWEWVTDTFAPYPGFEPGPYREYSEPWFHTHKVLRGGCWATRSRLIRTTWRNFYQPHRRDVWAGFRTCAA